MNETDEFILDAFKQQGLANDELIGQINEEVNAIPDGEAHDKDLAFMNILLEKTGMPKEEVLGFLSAELNMESVDLSQVDVSEDIISILKPEWAKQYEVMPLGQNEVRGRNCFCKSIGS